MKKPKFKFVKQEEECGCAIACIAMILGKAYEQVVGDFNNDFSKQGINSEKSADYLSDSGVDVIVKAWHGFTDRKTNNTRMLIPFADIHLVSFRQYSDVDHNHAIIMLKNGKLICPEKKYKIKNYNCYIVDSVIGCFYDK